MKININTSEWAKALNKLAPLTASGVLPITECVLITASDKITAKATDTNTSLSVTVTGDVIDAGGCAIPFKTFIETLKALGNQMVQISCDETSLTIKAKKGKYKLAVMPAKDFPQLNHDFADGITFDSSELNKALKVAVCCSNDELRPALTGVYVHSDGDGCKFAATDAFSLAVVTSDKTFFESDTLIPRTAAKLLESFSGDVDIFRNDSHIRFMNDAMSLDIRLIDARFPQYQGIIPTTDKELTVNRSELLNCLALAQNFSDQNSKRVILKVNGDVLTITSYDIDSDKSSDQQIPCSGNIETVSFNAQILSKMLKLVDSENVNILQSDPHKPHLIQGDDNSLLGLAMPLQVVS